MLYNKLVYKIDIKLCAMYFTMPSIQQGEIEYDYFMHNIVAFLNVINS